MDLSLLSTHADTVHRTSPAPDDEQAQPAAMLGEELAAGLDENTVERWKAAAFERWEAEER